MENKNVKRIDISHVTDSTQKAICSINYLTLDSKPNLPIGSVDKVIVSDTILYILDKTGKSIFIYGISGKFLNVIASRGRGPNEYLNASDISIYNNKLYLLADRSKIYIYNQLGVFEKQIKVPGVYFDTFISSTDGIYIISNYSMNKYSDEYCVRLISYEGSLMNEYLPYSKEFGIIQRSLTNQSALINDSVSFILPYSDKIYKIGNKKAKIAFQIESKYEVLDADFLKENKITNQKQLMQNSKLFDLVNFYESNDMIIFQYVIERKIYTTFFNKSTNEATNIDNSKINLPGHINLLPIIVGITDNYVISTIPPQILVQIKEQNRMESFNNMIDVIVKSNELSNPVLVFYYYGSNS